MYKCDVWIVAYILVGFGTQSYIYNHEPRDQTDIAVAAEKAAILSAIGGFVWPVYWAGKAAHAVDAALTEAATPKPPICADVHGQRWAPKDGVCLVPEHSSSQAPMSSSVVTFVPSVTYTPRGGGDGAWCSTGPGPVTIYYPCQAAQCCAISSPP